MQFFKLPTINCRPNGIPAPAVSELALLCPSEGVTRPGIDISILESVMRETARILTLIAVAASLVCAAQDCHFQVATCKRMVGNLLLR
jgi:hypothetical protein